MKLYLAAAYNSNMGLHGAAFRRLDEFGKYAIRYCQHWLESYHYLGSQRTVDNIRRDGRKIFLDSGAFSAFTKGVEVDIKAYAQFCKDNADIILMPSVLDAIGDPDGTWVNQKRLEDLGVACLPCYHYGEPEAVLEYYIANYDYITIGGMVPVSGPNLVRWLDRIWPKYLIDEHGQPRVKVHGFGLTSPDLMARYPWYSVDSSSWLQISSFGAIFLPGYGTVHLSHKAPNRKIFGQHYQSVAPAVREKLDEVFAYYGFTAERLQRCYVHRRAFNALTYNLLANKISSERAAQHVTQQRLLL